MRREIKLGIFVTLTLGVIALYLLFLGKPPFLKREKRYFFCLFDYISGLDIGAPVRLAGMKIGEVEDMKLQKDKILVKLRTKYLPKIDSKVSINSLGLIGEKYVEISLGSKDAPYLNDGDIINGINPVNVEELLFRTERMVKMLYESTLILEKLLKEEDKIKRLISTSLSTLDKVNNLIEENRTSIKESIRKINLVVSSAEKLLEENRSSFKITIEKVKSAALKINPILTELETTAKELNMLIKATKNGEGILAKMLYDKKLTTAVSSAVEDLGKLVAELREHPEYILRGKKRK